MHSDITAKYVNFFAAGSLVFMQNAGFFVLWLMNTGICMQSYIMQFAAGGGGVGVCIT